MQRYMRGMVPYGTAPEERQAQSGFSPQQAAVLLGETVRAEHGREGVRMYVRSLSPLIPRQLLEQTAQTLGVEPPPPEPPRQPDPPPPPPPVEEPKRDKGGAMGGMKPEQLLKLFSGMKKGDGGGLDPMMLLNLMKE